MNYQRALNVGLLLIIAVLVVMLFRSQDAQASTIHNVLAIESVPEQSHDKVTFEFAGYYSVGVEGDSTLFKPDIKDPYLDEGPVWIGGAGFGLFGYAVGAAVVHDRNPLLYEAITSVAVAATVPLSDNVKLRVGLAKNFKPNYDGDYGVEEDSKYTFGAKLRFGW